MNPQRPGPAGGSGPDALPPDELLRQNGTRIVRSIAGTLRIGKSYDTRNQAFLRQIDTLVEIVKPVLAEHGEAVLVAQDADLFLNGVCIPVSTSSYTFSQAVREMLSRQRIAGLRFEPGVTARELGLTFELLLKTGPTGAELLAAWNAHGIRGASPIVAATTDPNRAPFPGEVGARPARAHEPASDADRPGPSEGPSPRPESPERRARRRYAQALEGARLLLAHTSQHGSLEVRHAKRVVQPLVEGVASSEPALIGLATLTRQHEHGHAHAVRVCAVSVSIGHLLGLDRGALADLGVAALFHDIGKQAVAGRVSRDLESFTPQEKAAAERHPLEGAKLLARSATLNPTTLHCMRVALEHHATTGKGTSTYPELPQGWRPSLLSQIVAAADCFISLQSRRSRVSRGVSPSEALGIMLGPLAHGFEPALLWALVQSVGYYPAGQIVELDDGSLAGVLAPNPSDPARPHVRVLDRSGGARVEQPEHSELRPIPPHRSVRRALWIAEYPEGAEALLAEHAQFEAQSKAA